MDVHIPNGGFTVARKIFTSGIWTKDPLYLKLWIWIIGRASFESHEKNGYKYKRGEFVTTHSEIIKALTYRHNRRKISPSVKMVRIMLQWLESEGMIYVNPLMAERCRTGAHAGERTGAYIGIKISVVNYDTYQEQKNYKGRHKGRHLSEQGHDNNNGHNNNGINYMSIPFKEIQDAYHKALPELPSIQKWTEARKQALSARWNSKANNQSGTPINTLQYWIELFQYIRKSPHLMGKNNRGWKANIDFILKESSFTKIIEGQYH